MRFVAFSKNGVETAGARIADSVVDLSIAAPHLPGTLLGLIQADALETAAKLAADAPAKARRPLGSIVHLPVLAHGPKIVSLIKNHVVDGARPTTPGLYVSVATRICAHLEPMLLPKRSSALDCGMELAVVLKKGGRHIAPGDALDHVAGYSIFTSGEVLGLPAGQTVAVSNNSDKTASFGPEFVTPDELPSGAAGLRATLRRNGVAVRESNTKDLCWNVPDIISFVSTYMSLESGDVITSGRMTPSIAPDYLRGGEIIEADIERLGTLINTCMNET